MKEANLEDYKKLYAAIRVAASIKSSAQWKDIYLHWY